MPNSDPAPLSFGRYLGLVVALALLFLLLLGTFSVEVDPYDIWRLSARNATNAVRPEVPYALQRAGAILAGRLRPPQVLLIGSSRLRRGMDERVANQLFGVPTQIAGIDLLQLPIAQEIVTQIMAPGRLKCLYIEAAFIASQGCSPKLLRYTAPDDPWQTLPGLVLGGALDQSIATVAINAGLRPVVPPFYDRHGHYHQSDAVPAVLPFEDWYVPLIADCPRQLSQMADFRLWREVLTMARQRGIKVAILMLPFEAHWDRLVEAQDMAATVEAWKGAVKAVARQTATPVCQFEDWADGAPGDKPAPADGDPLPLFWDWIHFSTRIGNPILAALAAPSGRCAIP
ncbi:MAG: hypothetical protein P4M00_20155 [Azospirillaceae bacterium]|nr:hypothetical protein [Azospirillaceae bacterium]